MAKYSQKNANVLVAASETFTGIPGMSLSGRFQSSPSIATICEKCARNGRNPPEGPRLVIVNISGH